MKVKRGLALVLVLVTVLALGSTALARWDNISRITAGLSMNGNSANCSGIVKGAAGTSGVSGSATLYRVDSAGNITYTEKTWPNLYASGDTLIFSGSYYVSKGYYYRLVLTGTVSGESATAYSYITYAP